MKTQTQTESKWSSNEILEIAERQKQIIVLLLIGLVGIFVPFGLVITSVLQIYFVFKMAQALRSSAAWLYIILSLIPFVSLLALARVSGKATKILKENGVKVGFFGAKASDIEKIKANVLQNPLQTC